MVNELHLNFLKYFAIFGIMPYVGQSPMQQQQQQQQEHRQHQQRHLQQHQQRHHHLQLSRSGNHQTNTRQYHKPGRWVTGNGGLRQPLRWQRIYTVTLIVANLLTTLYGVIHLPFNDTSIIPDLVSIIVLVMHTIILTAMLMETMLCYDKYYELLVIHARVQVMLKQLLQTQLCAETIRQRQRRKYIFYGVSAYSTLIVIALVVILNPYHGYFWHTLMAILILRMRCLQMLIILDYVVYYLELLNCKLRALILCKISKNYQCLDVDYGHLESYDYMQNIKLVYQEIYVLHQHFNDIFGLTLMMLVCGIVLDIIIHVYWSFLALMGFYALYFITINVSMLLPLFCMIFMLCYTAEGCEKECNLILVSLKHLVRPTSLSQSIADYNALLQDFIMQILHNPIRISANDYFTLNLKFLMGVSANMVTYLVILLQFRNTTSANEEPSDNPIWGDTTSAADTNITMTALI